jgi:hypothetical protein
MLFRFQTQDCNLTPTWLSRVLVCPTGYGLASFHNDVSQFLKINLSLSLRVLFFLFLWRTLTNTGIETIDCGKNLFNKCCEYNWISTCMTPTSHYIKVSKWSTDWNVSAKTKILRRKYRLKSSLPWSRQLFFRYDTKITKDNREKYLNRT